MQSFPRASALFPIPAAHRRNKPGAKGRRRHQWAGGDVVRRGRVALLNSGRAPASQCQQPAETEQTQRGRLGHGRQFNAVEIRIGRGDRDRREGA